MVAVLAGWGWAENCLMDAIKERTRNVPTLSRADILVQVWHLSRAGRVEKLQHIFEAVLPFLTLSIQNTELFHSREKPQLVARAVLDQASVPRPVYGARKQMPNYADCLDSGHSS